MIKYTFPETVLYSQTLPAYTIICCERCMSLFREPRRASYKIQSVLIPGTWRYYCLDHAPDDAIEFDMEQELIDTANNPGL